MVYWAIRRPRPQTNQNTGFENPCPWKPEKFSVSVNTKLSDLW
jgi:hypothetical protein